MAAARSGAMPSVDTKSRYMLRGDEFVVRVVASEAEVSTPKTLGSGLSFSAAKALVEEAEQAE